MMQDLITYVVHSLPRLVTALVIFLIFWLIAKSVESIIHRLSEKSAIQRQPVFLVLGTFSKIAVFVIGTITALGSAGVNVSALVASFGLSGLAISIATKDAFANMLAGIIVLLYQPFKIGDTIQVGNCEGRVTKMSLRFTHLVNASKEILIPNSSLLTNNIIISHL